LTNEFALLPQNVEGVAAGLAHFRSLDTSIGLVSQLHQGRMHSLEHLYCLLKVVVVHLREALQELLLGVVEHGLYWHLVRLLGAHALRYWFK
jgi:hypothetical protein